MVRDWLVHTCLVESPHAPRESNVRAAVRAIEASVQVGADGAAGARYYETFHDNGPTGTARMLECYAALNPRGPSRALGLHRFGFSVI